MKKYLLILAMILLLAVSASAVTVYVSDGGTGDGASASSPLGSLTDAYTALGNDGGEIVLVGTVTVPLNRQSYTTTDKVFVEPKHDGKIILRGNDANATLLFASPYEYHMEGETEFRNMIISSGAYTGGIAIAARGYHLTMGEGLTMYSTGNVSGEVGTKIYLYAGCQNGVPRDGYESRNNHMTVKSGSYWVVGGFNRNKTVTSTGRARLELGGGQLHIASLIAGSTAPAYFKAPAGADIFVLGDFTMTRQISLGNQNTDAEYFSTNLVLVDGYWKFTGTTIDFNKRTRVTELDIYVNADSSSAQRTYSETFEGYGDRECTLFDFCVNELGGHTYADDICTRCGATASIENADVVYVSDGGTGDGTSASSPLGSLTDAYTALGNDGGEIVLCGTVTVPLRKGGTTRTAFVEPAHDGKITLRGNDKDATLLFASPYEYHMSGETELKDMIISSGDYVKGLSICARGHHLTMGEGLTMHSTGVVSDTTQVGTKIYLHGGCMSGATVNGYLNCDNHLTVKSGIYWGIIGFNRNLNVNTTGYATLEIGGDVSTHYLIAGSSGGSDFSGNAGAELRIIGDLTVTQQISMGNQNSRPKAFSATLVLLDGDVRMLGTLFDYSSRTRVTDFSAYVDMRSDAATLSYHRLFAGYADREGDLGDYCTDVLGGHGFVDGVCTVCGESGEVCTAHSFNESVKGTVVTHTCACGFTYKTTTKTTAESGVYTHTSGDVRVQILADGIVRFEEKYDGMFVDTATLVVPDRTVFTGTAVTADADADTVILSTEKFTVNIPKNGSAFDACIFDKQGALVYTYGTADKAAMYSSLPAPSATPDAYAIIDNGILPAEGGLTYTGSTDDTSDWERTDNTDIYVLLPFGDAEALRAQFITVTGPTKLSNIKTLGSWYSKWTKYSAEEKLALIEEFRKRDIPLDLFVIDTEWKNTSANGNDGDGTGYDTNDELYPDMPGFLAKAEAAGLLILFNDHTHSTSKLITNPEELEWQSNGILSLINMGLDGWWYDRNWSYSIKSPYSDVLYSTIGQVLYYDTMQKYHTENADNRVLMLSNVDWIRHGHQTGNPSIISHRYGTQWTGDIYWDPTHLKREVSNMVTAGINGASPYLSADLGGFWDKDWVSENNFLRWMQYGAFSPVYRPHGSLSSTNEHLPWSYGEESGAIVKDFLHMRYHLMPTYYALARENHDSGMPLARRLDFYYPQHEEAKDDTQYLIGKDILVAPFWGTSGDGRDVVPTEWLLTPSGEQGLKADYFTFTKGADRETFYDGTPKVTETVPTIDFYWYSAADGMSGSPATNIAEDYFAARFTGKITPAYDCYIGMLADDCARIYINGSLWVNWKSGQMAPNFNMTTPLKAGVTYDIVVDCYDNTGKSVAYLMCEPVLPENTSERTVFIPDGTWINAFTGEAVTGPKTVTVRGGTDVMPIYIRKGAAILTSDVISPLTGADWKEFSVNLYGLSETTATLYEDDGKSTDYLNGESRATEIAVTSVGDAWQIDIGAAAGEFDTEYTSRKVKLRFNSDVPVSVTVDGEPIEVTWIPQDVQAIPFANRGASNISSVYEVEVDVALAAGKTLLVTELDNVPRDINGDGTVNIADVLALISVIVNNYTIENGDLNADGRISLLDVVELLKVILA